MFRHSGTSRDLPWFLLVALLHLQLKTKEKLSPTAAAPDVIYFHLVTTRGCCSLLLVLQSLIEFHLKMQSN